MFYTYMVRCSDNTLYTGWTNDLEKRLIAHNSKKGSKYTMSRTPVEYVYYQDYETKSEAMSNEMKIKKLSKKEKELLIKNFKL